MNARMPYEQATSIHVVGFDDTLSLQLATIARNFAHLCFGNLFYWELRPLVTGWGIFGTAIPSNFPLPAALNNNRLRSRLCRGCDLHVFCNWLVRHGNGCVCSFSVLLLAFFQCLDEQLDGVQCC